MVRNRFQSSKKKAELDFTSMMDVIFNLLAYFIITYSPPLPEVNFDISLPPPKPPEEQLEKQEEGPAPTLELFNKIEVTVLAKPDGTPSKIYVAKKPIPSGMTGLATQIRNTAKDLQIGEEKVTTAQVNVSGNLQYSYLIQAIDACNLAGITKVNFSEIGENPPSS